MILLHKHVGAIPAAGPLLQPPSPARASRHPNAWWGRGVIGASVAYILASQALLDVSGWSGSAFVFAAVLGVLLAAGAFFRVWRLHLGKWLLIPACFVGYCLARSFSGIKDTAPLNTFAQTASAFFGGISLALAVRVAVSFKTLVYAQVAANLLQIVLVLLGVGDQPPPGEESFRYAGMTGNANLLALQLTLGACFIWLLPRKSGILPCAFGFGAVAFALAVTGSRKALLVAGFFLVLVLIQSASFLPQKRRRLWMVVGVSVAVLVLLVGGHSLWQHRSEILAVQRAVDYEDSSYRTRAEMVEQGLRLWQQAPILGHGTDAFRGLSGQGTYSHNNYVELLCDLGLVGTLLFYAVHAQAVFRAARTPPTLRVYCWVFVLMLLLADFGYVSYTSKQSVMILMFLTMVTTSRYAFAGQVSPARDRAAETRTHRQKPCRFLMRS